VNPSQHPTQHHTQHPQRPSQHPTQHHSQHPQHTQRPTQHHAASLAAYALAASAASARSIRSIRSIRSPRSSPRSIQFFGSCLTFVESFSDFYCVSASLIGKQMPYLTAALCCELSIYVVGQNPFTSGSPNLIIIRYSFIIQDVENSTIEITVFFLW
jgi:hypothetical protein